MPVVACPKCKTKLKLSAEMLGKAIRCKSCQAAFRTPAASAAKVKSGAAAKPTRTAKTTKPPTKPTSRGAQAAPAQSPAASPVKKKRSLEDEIFGSAPLPPNAPDPLSNFVLDDPGFTTQEAPEPEADEKEEVELFGDAKHLMSNPALKGRSAATNPYKAPQSSGSTAGRIAAKHFTGIKILGYIIMALCGVAALGFASLGTIVITQQQQILAEYAGAAIALYLSAFGSFVLVMLLGLIFWPIAHSNTTGLGATDQVYSPGWMVGCWFVPFANLWWPCAGIIEIYQASVQPFGKKWKKVEAAWQINAWWTLNILAGLAMNISTRMDNPDVDYGFWPALLQVASWTMLSVSLVFLALVIKKVVSAQYAHVAGTA